MEACQRSTAREAGEGREIESGRLRYNGDMRGRPIAVSEEIEYTRLVA